MGISYLLSWPEIAALAGLAGFSQLAGFSGRARPEEAELREAVNSLSAKGILIVSGAIVSISPVMGLIAETLARPVLLFTEGDASAYVSGRLALLSVPDLRRKGQNALTPLQTAEDVATALFEESGQDRVWIDRYEKGRLQPPRVYSPQTLADEIRRVYQY